MRAYGLEKCKCEKCGVIKMHELLYNEDDKKDYKMCLKCATVTEYKKGDADENQNH